jgi:hypothetical protein
MEGVWLNGQHDLQFGGQCARNSNSVLVDTDSSISNDDSACDGVISVSRTAFFEDEGAFYFRQITTSLKIWQFARAY